MSTVNGRSSGGRLSYDRLFYQWLTTKDPEPTASSIRRSATIDEWSFDKAMKRMFGDDASIEGLWNEYQAFLSK